MLSPSPPLSNASNFLPFLFSNLVLDCSSSDLFSFYFEMLTVGRKESRCSRRMGSVIYQKYNRKRTPLASESSPKRQKCHFEKGEPSLARNEKKGREEVKLEVDRKRKDNIVSRCFPKLVHEVINAIKENNEQVRAVVDMGFYSMFDLPPIRVRSNLTFLIDNFDPNSCSLKIGSESLYITDIDVHLILGIPLGSGKEVDKYGHFQPIESEADFFVEWRKEFNAEIPKIEVVKLKMFTDVAGGDSFRRNFIVFIVSSFLAPTVNQKNCNWRVVKSLQDISKVKELNWCSFVLSEMVSRIRDYKRTSNERKLNVGGCSFFFMLFYLDRVHHGGQPTVKRQGACPRMVGWTNELITKRINQELSEAGQYGAGKIVDDQLRAKLELKRFEEDILDEEITQVDQLNPSQEVDRFQELIDDVITASHECQMANKKLFEKIRTAQKAFPSQTVSICEYLKINAPVVQVTEDDEDSR